MCFHRFETLSHMLASIELTCSQKVDISDDAFIDKNAIQIARQLQALKGIDDDSDEYKNASDRLERRKTIQNLEKRRNQFTKTGTLDVAFKKRFLSISAEQHDSGSIAAAALCSGSTRCRPESPAPTVVKTGGSPLLGLESRRLPEKSYDEWRVLRDKTICRYAAVSPAIQLASWTSTGALSLGGGQISARRLGSRKEPLLATSRRRREANKSADGGGVTLPISKHVCPSSVLLQVLQLGIYCWVDSNVSCAPRGHTKRLPQTNGAIQ
ncbi:hypothetical protein BIW11_05023 [Tropilaelaps mercedesae]|uniref:Uncharacterized protein n=1 Tax=Tropilaelaps mercedesae TaxID=418985 RepID=A0A1V9WYE1_9ACAR|nr:hypothetical protein BIW11_05023 [Tropilaelaps mercedesae]